MIITITGSSGFLGTNLINYLENRYELNLIHRKKGKSNNKKGERKVNKSKHISTVNEILFDFKNEDLKKLEIILKKTDTLIHTVYSNELPLTLAGDLLDFYQSINPRGKFIYISSINTIIRFLQNDTYTIRKKKEESYLLSFTAKIPVIIYRPAFIVSGNGDGTLSPIFKFAKTFRFMPVFKSGPSHHFLPLKELLRIIESDLLFYDIKGFKVVNIIGKHLTELYVIIKKIIKNTEFEVRLINIPSKIVILLLQLFPYKTPQIKRILKMINNTRYTISDDYERIIINNEHI